MSLYNALMGYNPACIVFLPMLGRKQEEYPRFRDCFLSDDAEHIDVYTRVGGNNRGCGYGEEELYKDENYVETFDDDYDNTYATYRFKVPEKWKSDFHLITSGMLNKVSDEYVNHVKNFYPKLAELGIVNKIFRSNDNEEVSNN